MKSLIIGYGSIGKRHLSVLKDLNCPVAIVSKQDDLPGLCFKNIDKAIKDFNPQYVVICNSTNDHFNTLSILAKNNFTGTVLIEKPIFSSYSELPINDFKNVFVGYNLRFHPVLLRLKEILSLQKVLSANIYVGQFLPDWRPNQDYKKTYSANKESGGGVLRDLSHELDYTSWLFGTWKSLTSQGGKVSKLEIDTEDIFTILMKSNQNQSISIQMSYLDRIKQRKILINTEYDFIEVDLIKNYIKINGSNNTFSIDINSTYIDMHSSVINNQDSNICNVEEGLKTMKLIKAIEESNGLKWVHNE